MNEQKGAHGWIRTHPMIPIRFKACELAALDLTALRQQHRGFSWSGFRGIDTKIMGVLETLDKLVDFVPGAGPGGMGGGAALRGPREEDTQLAVFLALLHVALADGKIQWNQRAFITDLQMAMGTRLPVKHMMDAAEKSGRQFGGNAIKEIRERKDQFADDDVRKTIELAAVMICQHGRIKSAEQRAMEQIVQALGGGPRLVNEVVMFVQMNGPTLQKVLEGW
jgi:tellurite resistance protein